MLENFHQHISRDWRMRFEATAIRSEPEDWLGVFPVSLDEDPTVVFEASAAFCPTLWVHTQELTVPAQYPRYRLGSISRQLYALPDVALTEDTCSGTLFWIRVIQVSQSSKFRRIIRSFYLAPLARLTFDPGRSQWDTGDSIYTYTAKLGRSLTRPRLTLCRPIAEK